MTAALTPSTTPLLHGLFVFPITPADAAGHVAIGSLTMILARFRDAGVDSVGLLGSTGIYAYLTRSERRRAVEAAGEAIGGSHPHHRRHRRAPHG